MKRKTLAIPIRLVNFSDSSQILTLFTREFGIVEAIAKGAHRERNAFQGPFDLGVLWEVVFAERSPERGLSILTEGAVVEGFRGLRRSFPRWSGAAFILEYLRSVGTAGEASGELFDLARSALGTLGEPEAGKEDGGRARIEAALCAFEARALRLLGLQAAARACAGCGRPWSRSDQAVFFSAEAGGILCRRCAAGDPRPQGHLVPGRVVRALEDLSERGPPPETLSTPVEPDLLPALRALLGGLRVFLLDREFKMLKYSTL